MNSEFRSLNSEVWRLNFEVWTLNSLPDFRIQQYYGTFNLDPLKLDFQLKNNSQNVFFYSQRTSRIKNLLNNQKQKKGNFKVFSLNTKLGWVAEYRRTSR